MLLAFLGGIFVAGEVGRLHIHPYAYHNHSYAFAALTLEPGTETRQFTSLDGAPI